MRRLAASLVLAGAFTVANGTDAVAQCQTGTLELGVTQPGAITSSDCIVSPVRNATGEYWTLAVTRGDFVVVTMRRQTMRDPYVYVLGPSGDIVAENDDYGSPDNYSDALATFTAATTGEYQIVATTWFSAPYSTDYGTYTIRAELATTPLAPQFTTTSVVGSQVALRWNAAISPTPVLEYVLEVGNASSAANLGVFSLGASTQVTASAGQGTYYVRVRARNALGFGAYSVERVLVVGSELAAPTLFSPAVVGRRVTLFWSPPSTPGATYYELLIGSGPGQADLGTIGVGLVTSVSVDNVPPGAYYVRVRAGNARGPGDPSSEVVVIVF